MKGDALKGHLDLLVLSALRPTPLHGYAVIEAVRESSDGAFDLAEGTVYPVLHRLERAGWLASDWATVAGRQRRVYRLTAIGQAAHEVQTSAWNQFTKAMNAVVGRWPATN